jgi:protein SCO1
MLKTGFVLSVLAGIVIVITVIMIVSGPSGLPVIDSGMVMDQPKSLPDFELVTHEEKKLTRDDFRGQWSLLFTGFTSCPDICPATISILKTLDEKLQITGTDLEMYLLSVDPERDTPDIMESYSDYSVNH